MPVTRDNPAVRELLRQVNNQAGNGRESRHALQPGTRDKIEAMLFPAKKEVQE